MPRRGQLELWLRPGSPGPGQPSAAPLSSGMEDPLQLPAREAKALPEEALKRVKINILQI